MLVLGIDAGGTKTVCLLADGQGTVLGSARGGGANLQTLGELEVEKTLHDVMERAMGGRRQIPDAICLGIAGVDRPDDAAVIEGIMRRIGYKMPTLVVNDALIALVAGVGEAPGLVIVCGTGSICYGRNPEGKAARAGGWGYILGDEGSVYWIGCRALAAVARAADGRGPATSLTAAALAHFGVRSVPELVHEVHAHDRRRHRIASLGAAVQAAADAGDAIAAAILDEAADELTAAAASVADRLRMRDSVFPLVLSGGGFHGVPRLREGVLQRLTAVVPHAEPRLLTQEPALGAVRLAIAEAKGGAVIPQYWDQG
ncbi:MAG TPA: BadF/BadG/BcrA/BcrD ATPase family protein [Vicinamibacterales bacterium]|nr:BadF/BadG/BcrA/BcrD ATPase family protein [Vicinamibacterales bacterium]